MIHRSIGLTFNTVPVILDRPILLDWLVNEPYNVMGGFYKKLARYFGSYGSWESGISTETGVVFRMIRSCDHDISG